MTLKISRLCVHAEAPKILKACAMALIGRKEKTLVPAFSVNPSINGDQLYKTPWRTTLSARGLSCDKKSPAPQKEWMISCLQKHIYVAFPLLTVAVPLSSIPTPAFAFN